MRANSNLKRPATKRGKSQAGKLQATHDATMDIAAKLLKDSDGDYEVSEIGEFGRFERLRFCRDGSLALEKDGKCKTISLADSLRWCRERFDAKWWQDMQDGEAYLVWLEVIEIALRKSSV